MSIMKAGDVIFIWDDSLLSKLIRYFDGKGKFSHCVIMVSDTEVLEAQYSTKSHIIPFSYDNYEIVDLGLSDTQRKRVQELSHTLTGHRYDFIQIISYLIRDIFRKFRIINNPKNYICSEIVEILLQEVGVIQNDKNLRDMSPNELYKYLKSLKN